MKVYVVMTNDYPAAVFSSLLEAEIYVVEKMKDQRANATHTGVSWRSYEFDLNDTRTADAFHQQWMARNQKKETTT